ncbi:hypothetical protein D9757_001479 [Collybiopsis confluens]|uniref:Uncharacterized protein n=1 Tax=Collybiopsis confluens TaxID=2823264 RepID=A0A8H5CNJ0_9AGAR|nr:hypothetical protein D9757_013982 [Collybiopsis confluens]KAF5392244.1 hypothetical protein D9757_001479 [Collybiopsis confluens]
MGPSVRFLHPKPQRVALPISLIYPTRLNQIPSSSRLRRIYITFNAKHPINAKDEAMLAHLSTTLFSALSSAWASSLQSGDPKLPRITQIQPIITKADMLPLNTTEARVIIDRLQNDIRNAVKSSLEDAETGKIGLASDELAKLMCLEPLVSSARTNPPFGILDIRKNIVEACVTDV